MAYKTRNNASRSTAARSAYEKNSVAKKAAAGSGMGYTRTATNRTTGQKTTTSGVLKGVSEHEFASGAITGTRTKTPIAKKSSARNVRDRVRNRITGKK